MGPIAEGELVAGRYRVAAELGAGGMGVVLRARDERLERDVALKVLPPSTALDETARARLVREARAAAALSHPGIVHVYDVGETDDGGAYIAMELVTGRSLRALGKDGTLSRAEVVRAVADVARALAFAHRAGVVHRDVKPDNVMRRDDGRVVVLDFGLAKGESADGTTITATGDVIGTPAYLAPEQARGGAVPASDQFALAVTLFELLTGRLPWNGETPTQLLTSILLDPPLSAHELDASLAPELDAVLRRALEKEPRDRFPDLDAFADALEALPTLAGSALATPVSLAPTVASTPRGAGGARAATTAAQTPVRHAADVPVRGRRRRAGVLAAAAVALLVAAATVAFWHPWAAQRAGGAPAPDPLAAAGSVLACPPLRVTGTEAEGGWLGAAAAASLCDRARVVLGGARGRVRAPFELLGLPASPVDDGPEDPYDAPDARSRALAAARTADGWLDGTVRIVDGETVLHVEVRARDGRSLGAGDAHAGDLHLAVVRVVRALLDGGAMHRAPALDPDFATWSGTGSVDDALLVQAVEGAETRLSAETCAALAHVAVSARPPTLERGCPTLPRPPPADPAMPSPELARAALWAVPPEARAAIGAELSRRRAAETSPLGRGLLGAAEARALRSSGDFGGARRAALAAIRDVPDQRWAWSTLVFAQYETPQHEPTCLGWTYVRPQAVGAWANLAFSQRFGSDGAVRASEHGYVLNPENVGVATDLGVLRLVRGERQSARQLAAQLLGEGDGAAVAGEILDAACDATELSFGGAVSRDVALLGRLERLGVYEQQDWYLPFLAVEPALATGRAQELADAYVERAFGTDPPRLRPDTVAVFRALPLVLLASAPDRAKAMAAIARMTARPDWREQTPGQVAALRGAELWARGDVHGAALAWRPLVSATSGPDRVLAHVVVPVFDEVGETDLAEQFDAAVLEVGTPWNGASLAHVRMAKRALARGDVARARELAQKVVDAWGASDVPLAPVREMRALLDATRAR